VYFRGSQNVQATVALPSTLSIPRNAPNGTPLWDSGWKGFSGTTSIAVLAWSEALMLAASVRQFLGIPVTAFLCIRHQCAGHRCFGVLVQPDAGHLQPQPNPTPLPSLAGR
jgi:hypothetical protein